MNICIYCNSLFNGFRCSSCGAPLSNLNCLTIENLRIAINKQVKHDEQYKIKKISSCYEDYLSNKNRSGIRL